MNLTVDLIEILAIDVHISIKPSVCDTKKSIFNYKRVSTTLKYNVPVFEYFTKKPIKNININ